MKSLEQRREEVFRRSEQRIQLRRRRRRAVVCCMPLAICAVVGAAMAVPAVLPLRQTAPETASDILCRYATAEIRGVSGDYYRRLEDMYAVAELVDTLDAIGAGGGSFEEHSTASETDDCRSDMIAEKVDGYRILLTAPDGSRASYLLTGDRLTKEAEGREWRLTDEQLAALYAAAGLPE